MDLGSILVPLLLFIVVVGGLVLIHELGHYLTAKALNVRVLEFGIGFPPRAKVLRSKGETLWTLNWLPIGGFVRLEGEDGDAAEDPRAFSAQSLPARLGILVAGVVMNVLVAFVIFVGIAWLATPLVGVTIPSVQADSPASRAGLVAGDSILKVDGQGYDLYSTGILTGIRSHLGETVTLTVRHADGSVADVSVTLRGAAEIDAQHGPLGIVASPEHPFEAVILDQYASRPLPEAVGIAVLELPRWASLVLGGLGDLVSGFFTNPTAPPAASGPIGIANELALVFSQTGAIGVLYLAGILSINLAVVNILPFPPLDGGRMFVLILKRFTGRRFSLRAERVTYAIGFVVLLAFVVWISGFDIGGR